MGKENFVELSNDELREISLRGEQAERELRKREKEERRRKKEEREARRLTEEEYKKTSLLETWRVKRRISQRETKKRVRRLEISKGDLFCDFIGRLSSGQSVRQLFSRRYGYGTKREEDYLEPGQHPADKV